MKKFAVLIITICVLGLALCACSEAYKLSFAAETYTVKPNTAFTPEVKIRPKKQSYTISCNNDRIATVENNAVIALREGIATLTVTSGDLSAECTLYVKEDVENSATGIVILTSHVVNLQIVNYQLAELKTGVIQNVIAIDGSRLAIREPQISGFFVDGWYADEACTDKFDMATPIYEDKTLYCRLVMLETDYNVVNGYVTGLTYPKLPHEELVLPAREANGNIIYGIADHAFEGDATIKKVTLPAGYRTVGTAAFAGCSELTEVIIPTGSVLHTVGENAFGAILENGKIKTACGKLSVLDLPDTVTSIGSFAFYGCESLDFDGIPSKITAVDRYAFAMTGIDNIDLSNIVTLYEGAFFGCKKLATVTNTEGVTRCDKLVFNDTQIERACYEKCAKSDSDDDAAYYAETILFGCYGLFGKGKGGGKLRIKEGTTLIADEAFAGGGQTELTLYVDTESAARALDRDFLGRNVFRDSAGVFLVVGEGQYDAYCSRYDDKDRPYKNIVAEAVTVEVVGDDNNNVENWGRHILLRKKAEQGGYIYYYDKFIPFEKGTPRNIVLSKLGYDIERVNMCAFAGVTNLVSIELFRVRSIAYMAIAGCSNLKRIDLTKTVSPTVLEDNNSVQFSSINSAAKIYVNSGDYQAYRLAWSNRTTAIGRLISE